MLRFGEINPLNTHGLRQMDFCPPHFEKVLFDIKVDEHRICDWIWSNLSSRFYIGEWVSTGHDARRSQCKIIAFEDPSEATYFGLFLDRINDPNLDIHSILR